MEWLVQRNWWMMQGREVMVPKLTELKTMRLMELVSWQAHLNDGDGDGVVDSGVECGSGDDEVGMQLPYCRTDSKGNYS